MAPAVGAFGVVKTDGWKAGVIRLVTQSSVNHAFLYLGDGAIIEANPDGADIAPVGKYPDAIWSQMPLTSDQRLDVVTAARKLRGTPYSWVDVVCIGLARIFGWDVPETVRKRLNRRTRLMCSQLVDVAYHDAGIELFHGRIAGDVSPGDLLALIAGQANAKVVSA